MLQTLVSKELLAAFRAACDEDDEDMFDCTLEEKEPGIDDLVVPLSDYMVGSFLVVPTMCDDNTTHVRVLSVVGFKHVKDLGVDMGNPSCVAKVYAQNPSYAGERAVLLECACEDVFWVQVIK